MKYEVERLTGEVKITFALTAEEWDAQINKAYLKEKSKINIPGFRKGQAPRKMIEKMYGPSVFFEEAFDGAFNDSYFKALDENEDIFPVDSPRLAEEPDMKDGLKFAVIVTVKPEVTLGDYKGIKIEKAEYTVTAKNVNEEIKKAQEQASRRVEVTDRAVKDGDIVTLDYKGMCEEVQFEGGTAENQELTIGSNTFIPGFEAQMVGMTIGETKDLNVKFPDEYHAENLKGKDAVFTVTVKKIEAKELPELNDEFAKNVSKFETFEEYKADVKANLKKQNEEKANRENETNLLTKIIEGATVEIPACMIEKQIDYIVRETEYQLSYMYRGLKFEDYLKYTGMTMEDFRKQNESRATQEVKSQLVFEAIIKAENITVTDEQVDAEVAKMAESAKKTAEEYKKDMDPRQLDYIRNDVLMTNLLSFLKANNTFEKKAKATKKEKDAE
ncbi:MAG: trigger factor [Clostridia bacterium]|nr:trigger factor [Clostridia bacterium]